MFKKIYLAFAVALLTALVSWVEYLGGEINYNFLIHVNWPLVGYTVLALIVLFAFLSYLFHYIAGRKSFANAASCLWQNIMMYIILPLAECFRWRPMAGKKACLKFTGIVLISTVLGVCFLVGSFRAYALASISINKMLKYDKIRAEMDAKYGERLSRYYKEKEEYKQQAFDLTNKVTDLTKQNADLWADNKSMDNTLGRLFGHGAKKKYPTRPLITSNRGERLIPLGNVPWRTTGYNFVQGQCPDDRGMTYSGRQGVLGYSVAIDPAYWGNLLRQGAIIKVEGIGRCRIDDTGNLVKGKYRADIACATEAQADIINGYRRVWLVVE